jgi:ferredoxin-NADP reductase/RimJ/RimL family protein N-acetyltransferase/predicted pyridoxine 5'-phosphate oxidase superfamily flavin-nucleotide-binding protein
LPRLNDLAIESDRLVLRRFSSDDVPAILELSRDPGVHAAAPELGDNAAEAAAYVRTQNALEPWQPEAVFDLALERRSDGMLIGLVTLVRHGDDAEIGYAVRADARGEGLATEAARALIAHAFDVLGARLVFAETAEDNRAARRVAERAGLLRSDRAGPSAARAVRYELGREAWRPGGEVGWRPGHGGPLPKPLSSAGIQGISSQEDGTMAESESPFHVGERHVQQRLGVREAIEPWARKVVRSHLPEEHRGFYGQLPFLVAAARDQSGRPWATILAGDPGFVRSPHPQALTIAGAPARGDALEHALASGADVGFLGIELATRRRNRINGRVSARHAGGLEVAVDQAFGNCPQYIHEREWRSGSAAERPVRRSHATFTSGLRSRIENADTFFIASGHRGERESAVFGMDASHRGGEPGFVRVLDPTTLVFPDYAGNDHYNTIGNLVMDPRAGLLFVDFERGGLLQLTGRVRIDWDSAEVERFPGARRLIYFELDEAVELEAALPLRWDPSTGSVRSLRVVEKTRESDEVTSFVFEARDGGPLPEFTAGQHLPIELDLPDLGRISRTYSLSGPPGRGRYRISVKRHPQGLASRLLHDSVGVGDILSARAPAGDFVLGCSGERPLVLVSAGVGLTPLVSMLHDLLARGDERPVWFVHGARDGRHHPLAAEVAELARRAPQVQVHVAYSRPSHGDEAGLHYQSAGRVDGALLAKLVPGLAADFYMCGPAGFMAALQDDLEGRGVPSDRMHSETF